MCPSKTYIHIFTNMHSKTIKILHVCLKYSKKIITVRRFKGT